uniref:Connector enhancer of kinase suppressor of Ras 1 n=1 Tax=Capra hircus TaxID=9925 RepID=A0A8C2N9N9_CAPHI
DYCFEDWELPGKYLLQLCPRSLEALTVWPLGVEQLRALSSGLQSENLQSLTEGLLEGTRAFQSLVRGRLGGCVEPPADVLGAAVQLVHEARSLLFWLNRYLFSHLNDFSSCQAIGELCGELGQALQEDCPAAEKESKVLRISSHVAGVCCNILSCCPEELLKQKAVLEQVPLDDPSGLEIHTTSNCLHFVSRVGTQVRALQPSQPPSPMVLFTCQPSPMRVHPSEPHPPTPGPHRIPAAGPARRRDCPGVATRRRVSCRELGPPDCDGWLLLRKVPGGFMGPRWRRCWFVLKGHTLPEKLDEKAEGLINVSNYSLESGQDQKKKYVFQLTHNVYKPFIFAADTLTDLSTWVRHLITCISKYQSPGRASLPREEDCYSETEAEDPDDEAGSCSASPSQAQAKSSLHGDPSPAATPQGSPQTSFSPGTDSSEGALEGMVRGLRLGGVSLLGKQQPLTQEQWRSSFMRRNRDPQLNERVHRVRALQSTLKAKLQELQALEEVLGDPELTGEKFRRWKEQNQELYSEGLGAWGGEQAEGGSQVLNSDPKEQSSHPPPSDPEEQSDPRPPDL